MFNIILKTIKYYVKGKFDIDKKHVKLKLELKFKAKLLQIICVH